MGCRWAASIGLRVAARLHVPSTDSEEFDDSDGVGLGGVGLRVHHQALRGCKVAGVWPTTARGELRWHYGGFIFDTAVRPLEGGGGMDLWVRAVFPDGFEDWWSALPDPAFAFEGRGQKVASEKVERARRSCGI